MRATASWCCRTSCPPPTATPCRHARPSWWRASIRARRARSSRPATRAMRATAISASRAAPSASSSRRRRRTALNKIGHALHDLDPVFDRFSRQPQARRARARSSAWRQPLLLQSMYIFKQPGIGGEVGWHQDATYLHTTPAERDRLLDRPRRCRPRQRLPDGPAGRASRPLAPAVPPRRATRWSPTLDATPWPAIEPVALEVRRGTLVVLHGLLPHASAPNRSARPRHAYSLASDRRPRAYEADNWLQRPDLPLRGFA